MEKKAHKQAACKWDEAQEIKWMMSKRERERKRKQRDRSANCANATCFSLFFFFFWLLVQFAKLNLMRNLFTPSGFSFTAVYYMCTVHTTHATAEPTYTFRFSFQRFLSAGDESTKWQRRNGEEETVSVTHREQNQQQCTALQRIKQHSKHEAE